MPLPETETFNIKFVQTVEKYKCLYDSTLRDQGQSSHEREQAWNEIADIFSSTGTECKVRWKYLRGGLTRFIKRRKQRSARKFYLWDVMQFVVPFLRPRDRTVVTLDDSPEREDEGCNDVENVQISKAGGSHKTSEDDSEKPVPKECSTFTSTTNTLPTNTRKRTKSAVDDVVNDLTPSSPKQYVGIPYNPDLSFFHSILSDVASLNPSQKRRFKLQVLQLLDDIANESLAPQCYNSLDPRVVDIEVWGAPVPSGDSKSD